MDAKLSTRFLLAVVAVLVLVACVYFLFSILGGRSAPWQTGGPASMTVEEKAAVLDAVERWRHGSYGG